MNAEVDNVTVSGLLTSLDIRSGKTLNALVEFEQSRGVVNVDGRLNAREYMLWGGILNGKGTITTETLFNVAGLLSASLPGQRRDDDYQWRLRSVVARRDGREHQASGQHAHQRLHRGKRRSQPGRISGHHARQHFQQAEIRRQIYGPEPTP